MARGGVVGRLGGEVSLVGVSLETRSNDTEESVAADF